MSQIISIGVGGGGSTLASTAWELYCLQHNILNDGSYDHNNNQDAQGVDSYFRQNSEQKKVPRAVFFDTGPDAINEIRKNNNGNIFQENCMVNGKEDSAGIAARAMNLGGNLIDLCLERVRMEIQKCESLAGFNIFRSIGGGTGSGCSSILMERLSQQYQKKHIIGFTVYPSAQTSCLIPETYNTILGSNSFLDNAGADFVFGNSALERMCNSFLDIEQPNFRNLNQLCCHAISNVTGTMRFQSALNKNPEQIIQRMVPHPSIPFLQSSFSQIVKKPAAPMQQPIPIPNSVSLSKDMVDKKNLMIDGDLRSGQFLALCFYYQGVYVTEQIHPCIEALKTDKSIKFVDWCPTGFKCGINDNNMVQFPDSSIQAMSKTCYAASNSSSIKQFFQSQVSKVRGMFKKKAYLHWFVNQGIQQSRIQEQIFRIQQLIDDYYEAESE